MSFPHARNLSSRDTLPSRTQMSLLFSNRNDQSSTSQYIPSLERTLGKEMLKGLYNESIAHVYTPQIYQTLPPPPSFDKFKLTLRDKSLGGNWGRIFTVIDAEIPEDSFWKKLLCCIPVIGILPTVYFESTLRKKITGSSNRERIIKLITVKNDYKIASMVRESLTIALLVTAVVFKIFAAFSPMSIVSFAIEGMLLGYHVHCYRRNQQLITLGNIVTGLR